MQFYSEKVTLRFWVLRGKAKYTVHLRLIWKRV